MKYSKEELREMANIALKAKENGDPRWIALVFQLVLKTNLAPHEVELQIMELAK